MAVGARYSLGGLVAEGVPPAREQPGRRVERDGIELRDQRGPFAREPPQHRIDQSRVARRAAVALRETDGKIHRGMVRHLEKQDLRRADQQHRLDPWRIVGKAALQELLQHVAQRAEPAQHGGGEHAHQRAVTVGQRSQPGMHVRAVQFAVERTMAAQHIVEDIGRDAARREARDLGGRATSRSGGHRAQLVRPNITGARSEVPERAAESCLAV